MLKVKGKIIRINEEPTVIGARIHQFLLELDDSFVYEGFSSYSSESFKTLLFHFCEREDSKLLKFKEGDNVCIEFNIGYLHSFASKEEYDGEEYDLSQKNSCVLFVLDINHLN
jgi:hypothetical protein